jgi:hypothetical protein
LPSRNGFGGSHGRSLRGGIRRGLRVGFSASFASPRLRSGAGPASKRLVTSRRRLPARKLVRPRDYSRFTGQKVKISLREPVDGTKRYEGVLTSFVDGIVTLETPAKPVAIPFDLISKANLKFEW